MFELIIAVFTIARFSAASCNFLFFDSVTEGLILKLLTHAHP
jgi:hypothetical protein